MTPVPTWFYNQSGAIPFRMRNGKAEVLLITSHKGRWIVPKGVVEPDLSPTESAAEEAYEEAGVRGDLFEEPVGVFTTRKWGGVCTVVLYAMQVTEQLRSWPEQHDRERQWVPVQECPAMVTHDGLREVLKRFEAHLETLDLDTD